LEDCIKDAALFDGDVAVCYENEKNLSLKSWATDKKGNIAVFVGAEGGFSATEIEMFTEKNIPAVTLGNLILRAETAAIAVAAFFCLNRL
ncbi:MAG: RsmE family RNA methyltransferase, partial [Clostridiales bacterium]|nr:RsmE family RNA methyltransferase [Clostridiales bacterium]